MKDMLCPFVCDNKTEFGCCRTSVCINLKYNSPRSITLNRPLNNKWISIADKLPEELNYIIVYSQDNGIWMARFIDNRFYLIDDIGFDSSVSYWMPLPGPPSGE